MSASSSPPSKKQKISPTKNANGVLDYLSKSLPKEALLQLFCNDQRGRYVCRAVLQQLSQVTQQIVTRLACTGGVFPKEGCLLWMKQSATNTISKRGSSSTSFYLNELRSWSIIEDNVETSNVIKLTNEFYKGLQASLQSLDSSPWLPVSENEIRKMIENEPTIIDKEKFIQTQIPSMEDLERYTEKCWNTVLHFLVGSKNGEYGDPPPEVVQFLLQTNLMQIDPDYHGANLDEAPLVISRSGYDFMLQEQDQQIWHFIEQYFQKLESVSSKKGKLYLMEALLFLICLSFTIVGEGYSSTNLRGKERLYMNDLKSFGLMYVVTIGPTKEGQPQQQIFYPTRLAISLIQQHKEKETKALSFTKRIKALEQDLQNPTPLHSHHLGIIVQTNFQLCAYTTSELHVSMLSLFCEPSTIRRMPNMVFMFITRDSIKSAFAYGIQVKQILNFLTKHAHPKLLETSLETRSSPIPSNVSDQIWLWDRERRRVKFTKVLAHTCVLGTAEYQAVKQYCIANNALAYCSDARNEILMKYTHAEKVLNFVRQWRAQTAATS